MIYTFPTLSDPIKQGDIFVDIPCIQFEPGKLYILEQEQDKISSISWDELVFEKKDVAAVLGVSLVPAIVASQNCDTQRKDYITLCEIIKITKVKAFENIEEKTLRNVAKDLVKHNREKPEIFYLPPEDKMGFDDRMIVNFSNTIRLYREDLEKFIENRKGRLNDVAYEHFREKLSHFFHRYAWNDWYILNKEELTKHGDYSSLKPNQLYPYQK